MDPNGCGKNWKLEYDMSYSICRIRYVELSVRYVELSVRYVELSVVNLETVVGDFINIMKKTFDFNFDLYSAFIQHGYTKTWEQREAVN